MRIGQALLCAAALAGGMLLVSSTPREAVGQDKPSDAVASMDIELLKENLLKIWIIDESSDRYNTANIAEKAFELMVPLEPTGDPKLDAENKEARRKANWKLEQYIKMELDGAIEIIDICTRVLGKTEKATAGGDDAALKAKIATTELPAIEWNGKDLQAGLQQVAEFGKVELHFFGVPRTVEKLELDATFPEGFTIGQVLEFINGYHPIRWDVKDGKLSVEYVGGTTLPDRHGGR